MRIEVLPSTACHKYLGRQLSLDATSRTNVEIDNRCRCAWAKYHQCRRWLTNCHIHVQHRLKYLEMVVRPTALFSLHVLPLTIKHLQRIAAMQRRMIRNVVGWRRVPEEAWADTMRRMKSRVERAKQLYEWEPWDIFILKQQ